MKYFRQTKIRRHSFQTFSIGDWCEANPIEISKETYKFLFDKKKMLTHNYNEIGENQRFTVFHNIHSGTETLTEYYTI